MKKLLTTIILLCFSIVAKADYQMIGTMTGYRCTGFIIKSCGREDILYISRGDQSFELGQIYNDNQISAQETPNGRQECTIYPYGHPNSATHVVTKRVSNISYVYKDDSGELVKFKPDSVTFLCRRR